MATDPIIQPSSSKDRKSLFLQTLLNATDKVSKVADESVLSGIGGGIGKISGKVEKDIAIAFSRLFPNTASGTDLDQVAFLNGISARFQSTGSFTYVRIVAQPNTVYTQSNNTFVSDSGVVFELESTSITVPLIGYTYVKVRSQTTGSQTNVRPYSITTVNAQPSGHLGIVNEVRALGGQDIESDDLFRKRIQLSANILSKNTLQGLTQAFLQVNSKILRVFYYGLDSNNNIQLAVATVNGADLTQTEIDQLGDVANQYLSLSDIVPYNLPGLVPTITFVGSTYLDIDFRVGISNAVFLNDYRVDFQTKIASYLDYRTFNPNVSTIQWDDILQFAKSSKGAQYVPDQYFSPRNDFAVVRNTVPRLRTCIIRDLQGNVLVSDSINTIDASVFYPNSVDSNFQSTIL